MKVMQKIVIKYSLFSLILLLSSCTNNERNKPNKRNKPNHIPKKAVWKGGSDEGFWINLYSSDSSTFRFKIYDDFNGKLAADAYFTVDESCYHLLQLDDEKIMNEIFVFEDDYITFKNNNCSLKIKGPIIDGRMK